MSKDGFLLRGPELLAQARKAASDEGVSVSEFIRQGIVLRLEQGSPPRSETREDILAELAEVLGKLRKGWVLVPASEAGTSAGPGSWQSLMDGEGP